MQEAQVFITVLTIPVWAENPYIQSLIADGLVTDTGDYHPQDWDIVLEGEEGTFEFPLSETTEEIKRQLVNEGMLRHDTLHDAYLYYEGDDGIESPRSYYDFIKDVRRTFYNTAGTHRYPSSGGTVTVRSMATHEPILELRFLSDEDAFDPIPF